jgi:hypothetical protein
MTKALQDPNGMATKTCVPMLRKVGDGLLVLYRVQRFAPTDVSGVFPRGFAASSRCSAT